MFPITLILPWTKPGIWLFPNLFADVGVIDSFIPMYYKFILFSFFYSWGWSGIDYEKQHHEKYRSKNRSPQKKKKQNSETTSKPKIEKLSSKSPLSAPGGSLLEPTGITEIIDDGDQSDEPVEEIIMERKN